MYVSHQNSHYLSVYPPFYLGSRNRREVAAELLPTHDRCMKHPSCESQIKDKWNARLTADSSLYNGAKFRLAGMCGEGRKGNERETE